MIRLIDKILHDPKDPKLWELWCIPYYGSCRILSISRKNNHEFTVKASHAEPSRPQPGIAKVPGKLMGLGEIEYLEGRGT